MTTTEYTWTTRRDRLLQKLSHLLNGLIILAIAGLIFAQQHRVNIIKKNEQAVSKMLVKYTLENAALRSKLARSGE